MKTPSEEIYSKSTTYDFLLMVNSNRGRITYRLRDIRPTAYRARKRSATLINLYIHIPEIYI